MKAPSILDVLLLGAPDGKTELIDGVVLRQLPVPDPSQARPLFKALARELAGLNGIEWRKRFIEGQSSYQVGRFKLIEEPDRIQLEITVSPEQWRLFTWP